MAAKRSNPRGAAALLGHEAFDACKNGNLTLVKKLIGHHNSNIKDKSGRKSTPLHFAAGMIDLARHSFIKGVCGVGIMF